MGLNRDPFWPAQSAPVAAALSAVGAILARQSRAQRPSPPGSPHQIRDHVDGRREDQSEGDHVLPSVHGDFAPSGVIRLLCSGLAVVERSPDRSTKWAIIPIPLRKCAVSPQTSQRRCLLQGVVSHYFSFLRCACEAASGSLRENTNIPTAFAEARIRTFKIDCASLPSPPASRRGFLFARACGWPPVHDDALRAVDHFVGDLFAAAGRQAVHEHAPAGRAT